MSAIPVYLLREQHSVPVKRKKSIFTLIEFLKVERISQSDGRAVIAVAPRNPVSVFDPCHARIVFIVRLNHFRISRLETDRIVLDFPVNAVIAEPGTESGHSRVLCEERDSDSSGMLQPK